LHIEVVSDTSNENRSVGQATFDLSEGIEQLKVRGYDISNPERVKAHITKSNVLDTCTVYFRRNTDSDMCGVLWYSMASEGDANYPSVGIGHFGDVNTRVVNPTKDKMSFISELSKLCYKLDKGV